MRKDLIDHTRVLVLRLYVALALKEQAREKNKEKERERKAGEEKERDRPIRSELRERFFLLADLRNGRRTRRSYVSDLYVEAPFAIPHRFRCHTSDDKSRDCYSAHGVCFVQTWTRKNALINVYVCIVGAIKIWINWICIVEV